MKKDKESYKLNKRLRLLFFVLFLAALITVTASGFSILKSSMSFDFNVNVDDVSTSNVNDVRDTMFYLCEYEGKIGIFNSAGADAPLRVLNVNIVSLTELDRELFKNGLWVTQTELTMLIEDLES